jgi:hypothetical protein
VGLPGGTNPAKIPVPDGERWISRFSGVPSSVIGNRQDAKNAKKKSRERAGRRPGYEKFGAHRTDNLFNLINNLAFLAFLAFLASWRFIGFFRVKPDENRYY